MNNNVKEFRVVWQQCPHVQHDKHVLFIERFTPPLYTSTSCDHQISMTTQMPFKPLSPERLTWSDLPDGVRYELWRTPAVKPGWHLYGFQDGLEVSRKPVSSELRGRIEFEKRVEEHSA